MRVVIAGGHGQIALLLEKVLADRGDQPVGIVRNPDHVADVEAAGAEAVVLDLEQADVDARRRGAPGRGRRGVRRRRRPGQRRRAQGDRRQGRRGAARRRGRAGRRTSLRDGLLDGHRQGRPGQRRGVPGLPARQEGGRRRPALARDLDWTVVRPGRLTDAAATGRVQVGAAAARRDPARRRGRPCSPRALQTDCAPSARRSTCSPAHQTIEAALAGSEPTERQATGSPVSRRRC